ncbi:MAG: putative ABC transporter permease [Candidatus Coprovivens sp.]
MNTMCMWFILFIFYSFIGWLWEVVDKIIEEKKLVNRGFLIGPYCPIYGVGCLLLVLLLSKYREDLIVLFIMAILICSILEYSTSYIMEKLFNARWWDYSKQKFNINGRICAETMIPFGILGCVVVGYVNPCLINILNKFNVSLVNIISIILMIIFVLDLILSTNIIFKFTKTMTILEKDGTEEITKMVREVFATYGKLYKRLVDAFPNVINYKDYLIKVKNRLSKELDMVNTEIKNINIKVNSSVKIVNKRINDELKNVNDTINNFKNNNKK